MNDSLIRIGHDGHDTGDPECPSLTFSDPDWIQTGTEAIVKDVSFVRAENSSLITLTDKRLLKTMGPVRPRLAIGDLVECSRLVRQDEDREGAGEMPVEYVHTGLVIDMICGDDCFKVSHGICLPDLRPHPNPYCRR